jgi:epoxide hydrolase
VDRENRRIPPGIGWKSVLIAVGEPHPYALAVPERVLTDLRARLRATRWPADPIAGEGWAAGADLAYVRELCAYWAEGYDWRAHERALNAHPGFRCAVDGVAIHFWHRRSTHPDAIPLLLLHGWPGSVYEFHRLVEPLAATFHVVVASLPGFGFSGAPTEPGWGPTRMGAALHALMTRALGYPRFGLQGGDWGGLVAAAIARAHPEAVVGLHLNTVLSATQADPDGLRADPGDTAAQAALQRRRAFARSGAAYGLAQGTVPRSIALAQADSPAGLAAWIVDKFRAWSDCDGDVERRFTKDQLLTNLMFSWAPGSVLSAARLYYESRRDDAYLHPGRVAVPTAVAQFPHDILPVVPAWVEPWFDLRRFTDMPRGGHFAALEEPDLLLADVRAFFADLRALGLDMV